MPLLAGLSRKRLIGELTDASTPAERVHGSVAAAVLAADRGARILRVHDVAATRQALAVQHAVAEAARTLPPLAAASSASAPTIRWPDED